MAENVKAEFAAAPITDYQIIISIGPAPAPSTYVLSSVGEAMLASDTKLRRNPVRDADGRDLGMLIGFTYSEIEGEFLPDGETTLPFKVESVDDLELKLLPRLSGMFVFLTGGVLPSRLYMDPGGGFPLVYSARDRLAASSTALLLDEAAYKERFRADLHQALIGKEGSGGWISGTLTAHEGVSRVLPNHYLDLVTWTTHRFWPRPGDFAQWRDFDSSAAEAARALTAFSEAANRAFDVAATMTAGFDSRLLLAGCRTSLDRCEFFTLEAPNAELDIDVSRAIAQRHRLKHRVLPLRQADEGQMAVWDRMVGDCMIEAPRRTHTTLGDLTGRNAMFTGMYGEVGRCRLYRQDLARINAMHIDGRFIIDRLTLPAHPELLADIGAWLSALEGQPNSVILDLAFHELKFGSWAMGQRPITNSVKLNFLPFAQRPVLEAFIGVEPQQKGTGALFWAIITDLWPELRETPVNKYGDYRDRLTLWKKLTNPNRVRRFLRDRLARAVSSPR